MTQDNTHQSAHTLNNVGPRYYLVTEVDFTKFNKAGKPTIWAPLIEGWEAAGISLADARMALNMHLWPISAPANSDQLLRQQKRSQLVRRPRARRSQAFSVDAVCGLDGRLLINLGRRASLSGCPMAPAIRCAVKHDLFIRSAEFMKKTANSSKRGRAQQEPRTTVIRRSPILSRHLGVPRAARRRRVRRNSGMRMLTWTTWTASPTTSTRTTG